MTAITAAILVIGNEILSGRTRDANIQFLAQNLGEMGIRLREVRIVADAEDAVVEALNALRSRYTYVFTSGGIGPTHDDITTACVAKAFGVPVIRHPEAEAALEAHYSRAHLNAARLKMADTPEGATLIANPISAAPGYVMGNVHVMAGVPHILQAMFQNVRPTLTGGAGLFSRTVTILAGEGKLAEGMAAIQDRHADVEIGSYPFQRNGGYAVAVVVRGTDADALARVADELVALAQDIKAPFETE